MGVRKFKTHCIHGHELKEVGVYSRGQCGECCRIMGRKQWRENREPRRVKSSEYHEQNRAWRLAQNKIWREANDWSNQVKAKKYGISLEDLRRMLTDAVCAICGGTKRLCIDHDHDTGALRGVICDRCNKGLGFLKTTAMLESAIRYLKAAASAAVVVQSNTVRPVVTASVMAAAGGSLGEELRP